MQGGLSRRASGALLIAGMLAVLLAAPRAQAVADDVLATVNGRAITQADLHLEAVLRHIPDDQMAAHRDELLDALIDRQLIAAFIERKTLRANPIELQAQLERVEALIRRRGEEPQTLLKRLGITREQLENRLQQSLAWQAYVAQATSRQQLKEYFERHRRQLDGTQLRAQHIFLKAARQDGAAREAARERLAELRRQIEAGEITFADAVGRHSQAPSAGEGGDVGYFGHRGTMPAEFADAAFALQVNEISLPVETTFGVHLIRVTDERPGQLSLEDAREQILREISQQMRDARIAEDRPRANIDRR